MPSKNKNRNGMYYFMLDIMPDLRKEGRVFPNGMADVVPIARPRWKLLPPEERQRYETIAKMEKQKSRKDDQELMDNQGNIISQRIDPHEQMAKRKIKESKITASRWPALKNDLQNYVFYVMHVEYLCRTEEGEYLPCEIAGVEFSLKNGVMNTFHKFIKPPKIPMGYRHSAVSHSEDTHQIPIEGFDLADDNYLGTYIQLENFINKNGEKPEYPAIYVHEDNLEAMEFTLNWIHSCSSVGHVNRLKKVFVLENMLADIYKFAEDKRVSETTIRGMIYTTNWDYEPNTRCEWHESKDLKHCALYPCNRVVYAVSNSLADTFDFELLEGKHNPMPRHDIIYKALPPGAFGPPMAPLPPTDPIFPSRDIRLGRLEDRFSTGMDIHANQDTNGFSYANASLSNALRRPKAADAQFSNEMTTTQAWGAEKPSAWGSSGTQRANAWDDVPKDPPSWDNQREATHSNILPSSEVSMPTLSEAVQAKKSQDVWDVGRESKVGHGRAMNAKRVVSTPGDRGRSSMAPRAVNAPGRGKFLPQQKGIDEKTPEFSTAKTSATSNSAWGPASSISNTHQTSAWGPAPSASSSNTYQTSAWGPAPTAPSSNTTGNSDWGPTLQESHSTSNTTGNSAWGPTLLESNLKAPTVRAPALIQPGWPGNMTGVPPPAIRMPALGRGMWKHLEKSEQNEDWF